MPWWSRRRFDLGKQYFHRQPARLVQVLGNGCEVGIFSHIQIIETNNSQLFRHIDIQLTRSFEHPQCLEIRCGENGSRWIRQIQYTTGRDD